jgi:ATP-binding cassette subfamily F protein 3
MDQLRPDDSPLRHLQRLEPAATEQELRDYLGGFAFVGDRALEPVAPLSGGEKARLALALLIRQRPNLLLLDEPTNHLDLDMRQALAEALQGYEGALVLVSHDRHLLRVTTDTLLLVDAGAVTPFDGSIDDYPAWIAARLPESDARQTELAAGTGQETIARRDQRRLEAERRRRTHPLRSKLRVLDERLAVLSARRTDLEQALAAPDIYDASAKTRLLGLLEDKRRLDEELAAVEGAWLDISETLERMQEEGA